MGKLWPLRRIWPIGPAKYRNILIHLMVKTDLNLSFFLHCRRRGLLFPHMMVVLLIYCVCCGLTAPTFKQRIRLQLLQFSLAVARSYFVADTIPVPPAGCPCLFCMVDASLDSGQPPCQPAAISRSRPLVLMSHLNTSLYHNTDQPLALQSVASSPHTKALWYAVIVHAADMTKQMSLCQYGDCGWLATNGQPGGSQLKASSRQPA